MTERIQRDIKNQFERIVEAYMLSKPMITTDDGKTSELEIRFSHPLISPELGNASTRKNGLSNISKTEFDRVVEQLSHLNFSTDNSSGNYSLRINIQDKKERVEINGMDLVQEYCRTNSIKQLLSTPTILSSQSSINKIKITEKTPAPLKDIPHNIDFDDFGFRVAYNMEEDISLTTSSQKTDEIISSWNNLKKTFRYLNRVRFTHPEYPIFADMSIVRSSSLLQSNHKYKPTNTIQESGTLTNSDKYEIELEIDNSRVGTGTNYDTAEKLLVVLRKCIRVILGAFQNSNYPLSFSKKKQVIQSYMKCLYGIPANSSKEYLHLVSSKNFVGPSSVTLEMKNIIPFKNEYDNTNVSGVPNIRNNYAVTDKADGERRLLYIAEDYHVYMIDPTMNVIFTGFVIQKGLIKNNVEGTDDVDFRNTIIDGEYIKYDKEGKIINLYAAFDIYMNQENKLYKYKFMPKTTDIDETELVPENKSTPKSLYRFEILSKFIHQFKMYMINHNESDNNVACNFNIECKSFYKINDNFPGELKTLLDILKSGLLKYNTDGIIFTPIDTSVAGYNDELFIKRLWKESFKWKPAEFNTVDFLVRIKKNKQGSDQIDTLFELGKNLRNTSGLKQYKTVELCCGFDEKYHSIHENSCINIFMDSYPQKTYNKQPAEYKAMRFQPSNPYDPEGGYTNILLTHDGSMMTEEGQYFDGNMIVEFRYDITQDGLWRWKPLRVRHDKTSEYQSGQKNFGNAYHVANNIWSTIHNPITNNMLLNEEKIPIDNDIYYFKTLDDKTSSTTKNMRLFHNRFVKLALITSVARGGGDTLIDFAVGKAGDLSKWIDANLSFVFGVDISEDNILNKLDGACARYVNKRIDSRNKIPDVIFLHGNSGKNIRSGDAFAKDNNKNIARAMFGEGNKANYNNQPGIYKKFGIAKNGFNVSSVQFAIHYFFENKKILHAFLTNIAQCTAMNGYFIGTCYDGNLIFNALSKKNMGESMKIHSDKNPEIVMSEIIKRYSQTGFVDDETSLGYTIEVFQESINNYIREYLVNFAYLKKVMADYGFDLISNEEAVEMNIPGRSGGSGTFEELYHAMMQEKIINKENSKNFEMSKEEKKISFLFRYFIFRKNRDVKINRSDYKISSQTEMETEMETRPKSLGIEPDSEIPKRVARKLKISKIRISEYAPNIENTPEMKDIPIVAQPERRPIKLMIKKKK